MPPAHSLSPLLLRARSGKSADINALILYIVPDIHAGVGAVAFKYKIHPISRADIEDLIHDIILLILAEPARFLDNCQKAASEDACHQLIRLFAYSKTRELLRRKRLRTQREPSFDPNILHEMAQSSSFCERWINVANEFRCMITAMRCRLKARGFQIFIWLFVEERTVEEVQALTGLNPAAIHQWRRRLRVMAKEICDV